VVFKGITPFNDHYSLNSGNITDHWSIYNRELIVIWHRGRHNSAHSEAQCDSEDCSSNVAEKSSEETLEDPMYTRDTAQYQVFDQHENLLYRSAGAPTYPFISRSRIHEVDVAGHSVRVACVTGSDGRITVVLAESLRHVVLRSCRR
jgi:hypothetical protein